MNSDGQSLPLNGIRVVDLSRVLAGPFCTMMLGDLGAEVIKVEAPGGSDDTRAWGPPFQNGISAYYLCTNRNKKSITLNLKSEEGQRILQKLILSGDVFIHNFPEKTSRKLRIDENQVRSIQPQIIYCSITGFGNAGPYKDFPGYDFIIQAMAGLMSITGDDSSGPMKVGVAISDVLCGLFTACGILAALYERKQSGCGQSLDMALFDAQVSALVNVASHYLISGNQPPRYGNEHPNIVPYQTFPTKDGQIVVAVGNDEQFARFCQVIEQKEWSKDPRFRTNADRVAHRKQLSEKIAARLRTRTTEAWMQAFLQAGVPAGPIQTLEQLFTDDHLKARKMVIETDHPRAGSVPLVASPLKFSRTPVEVRQHPPDAGEHTKEILRQLGIDSAEVEKLRDNGVI